MAKRWEEIMAATQAAIADGTLKPGDRLPSETELAAQWNVCRMTAHHAMCELHRQGLVVRKRRLGTVVAAPRTARSRVVALLFFNTNDFPQVDYIHGIRAGLPDETDLLFCDTRNDAAREAYYLHRMQAEADAIVCYPTCDPRNTSHLQRLLDRGFPLACVDRVPEGLAVDAVMTDNHGSTLDALRALQGRGHHRIAFFGYSEMAVSSARERYEAYRQAMREAGCPDAAPWTRLFPNAVGRDFAQMRQVVNDALFALRHQPDPPTAVLCKDDYFMAAALDACERQGLSVPEDFSILSFNDAPTFIPRLTDGVDRLVQQSQAIGRLAAERLQWRMCGEPLPPKTILIPAVFQTAGADSDLGGGRTSVQYQGATA